MAVTIVCLRVEHDYESGSDAHRHVLEVVRSAAGRRGHAIEVTDSWVQTHQAALEESKESEAP